MVRRCRGRTLSSSGVSTRRTGRSGFRWSADEEAELLGRLFADLYDEQVEVLMPPDYPEGAQVLRRPPGHGAPHRAAAGLVDVLAISRPSASSTRGQCVIVADPGRRRGRRQWPERGPGDRPRLEGARRPARVDPDLPRPRSGARGHRRLGLARRRRRCLSRRVRRRQLALRSHRDLERLARGVARRPAERLLQLLVRDDPRVELEVDPAGRRLGQTQPPVQLRRAPGRARPAA